jgi:hypothetical protein
MKMFQLSTYTLLVVVAVLLQLLLHSNECVSEGVMNEPSIPTVYIIISVKTNKSIVKRCVFSIVRHLSGSIRHHVMFVDDGSGPDTVEFERGLCATHPGGYTCLKNPLKGYTHAIR